MPSPTRQEVLARLGLAFPHQKVPAETFAFYLRDLGEIPIDSLERAVERLVRTSERFPTIRAIRETCAEQLLELPGEPAALSQVQALIAWGRERQGPAPAMHPIVKEALDQVGGAVAFRTSDEPGVVRGQFSRIYRDLRSGAIQDAQLAPALEPGPQTRELTA